MVFPFLRFMFMCSPYSGWLFVLRVFYDLCAASCASLSVAYLCYDTYFKKWYMLVGRVLSFGSS